MKVILFDFDGVIVDTFSLCYRIIKTRDAITEDAYRARFEGNINVTSGPPKPPTKDGKPFDFFWTVRNRAHELCAESRTC